MKSIFALVFILVNIGVSHAVELTKEDLKKIDVQFNRLPEETRVKPIILKYNDAKTTITGTKTSQNLTRHYQLLYSHVLHNENIRCIFYQEIKVGETSELPGAYDLYEADGKWQWNQTEPMPTYWKSESLETPKGQENKFNPTGNFPISFSLKKDGKIVKVYCAMKNHVNSFSSEKLAPLWYALFLQQNGIEITKNGKDLHTYLREKRKMDEYREYGEHEIVTPATKAKPTAQQ